MKRDNLIFTLVVLLTVCFTMMCGCGRNHENIEKNGQENAGATVMEKTEKWPDNDYTKAIVKPEIGTIDYVIFDEEKKYYAVFLKNVTLEDGEKYIKLLRKNGFETVSDDGNSVSIGVLLQKDNVGISVSASENILALYITLNFDDDNV